MSYHLLNVFLHPPGLPDLVSSGDRFAAASTLFHAATLVHWQILVRCMISNLEHI